jgi:hypothetical protein
MTDNSTENILQSTPMKNGCRLSLNNIKMVATWKYDTKNTDCTLCRKELLSPVQEPETNKINGDVTVGKCNHGFHTVCINSWLMSGDTTCPICHEQWKKPKNVGSSVYVYKSTTK